MDGKKTVVWILSICCLFNYLAMYITYGEEITLTDEEIQYIDDNPVVYVGVDPLFAPYEFIDVDGIYKGISADYLKLIEVKTGLTFEIVEGLEWHEAHDMAINGDVDMLPCVGITDERKSAFVFTESYLNFQRVLISRSDDKTYSFDELNEVDFGVQRNSSHFGFAMDSYGHIPETYSNNDELLLALSYGDIDTAITNYAASRYRIKELGLTNLKIDEVYDMDDSGLYMAIHKDKTMLRDIINKALVSITVEERTQISNKWLGIEQAPDYSRIIRTAVFIGVIVIILILIFVFWNYTLQKEIKRRKIVEEELKIAKREADYANSAKSIFLARMSHEIRTPLNAINGIGYLLENTKTSTIQKQYIKNLKSASYNLLGIVNDILDFSKIEAGEIKIEKIQFDLDELLNKTSTILMPKAIEKGIDFHVIKDINLHQNYYGDPTRIEQVLINLVNNAIKFTDSGEVCVEVQQLSGEGQQHQVVFKIKDTGIGISNEQMTNLFIPFHQLDTSITRKYGGTGLGLSISKKFVELLGGNISAESEYGKGSVFSFHLPLEIVDEKRDTDLTKVYPDLRDVNVLLYEEDSITKKLVVNYLESFHLNVRCAISPDDILRKLRSDSSKYQLLIMNINMKTSDSLEIIQLLNKPELKIILLAKSIHETQYEMAEKLGVKHIIMKPVISSILYNSIIQCFEEEVKEDVSTYGNGKLENNGINILLVEDNEVNQMIEKEILSQQGYTVHIAANGKIAVDICKENPNIKMVLMDIHMPVMDGYEATKRIREFNKNVPILAMTAVSFSNIREKCIRVGMDGYITKPVDPKDMFDTIKQFITDSETKSLCINEECECVKPCNYLDVQQGMLRIGNNKRLYFEVLDKYLLDLEEAKGLIEKVGKTEDFASLSEAVHKLKGTSGNVGALELFQSAKILMDAIRSGIETDLEPYYIEFVTVFNETEKIVKQCLNEYHSNIKEEESKLFENKEGALDDVSAELVKLNGLLLKSDLDAFKLVESLDSKLISYKQWTRVKQAMNEYKFKEATKELKELVYISET